MVSSVVANLRASVLATLTAIGIPGQRTTGRRRLIAVPSATVRRHLSLRPCIRLDWPVGCPTDQQQRTRFHRLCHSGEHRRISTRRDARRHPSYHCRPGHPRSTGIPRVGARDGGEVEANDWRTMKVQIQSKCNVCNQMFPRQAE